MRFVISSEILEHNVTMIYRLLTNTIDIQMKNPFTVSKVIYLRFINKEIDLLKLPINNGFVEIRTKDNTYTLSFKTNNSINLTCENEDIVSMYFAISSIIKHGNIHQLWYN